jgi:hypothetical protein
MGFLSKLFGRAKSTETAVLATEPPETRSPSLPQVRAGITHALGSEQDLVKLTGTTTFAKDAITRLAERRGAGEGGYIETGGTLQREPDNRADPHAVAVHVEGEKIGYLPGHLAKLVDLSANGARETQVQIFTELLPKGLRAEAWAWLAKGPAQWQWSVANRPPLSSNAKVAAHQEGIDGMVADALSGGGARAEAFERGMVAGVHYLQLVEPIKQLKREGRLEEALTLCYAAIEGAEANREGCEPAPWYTEQAAIIHRKLGQRGEEITVLTRWLAHCPPNRRDGSRIGERLSKLS